MQGEVTEKQVQQAEARRLQIVTWTTRERWAVFPTKVDAGALSGDGEGQDVTGCSLKTISSC